MDYYLQMIRKWIVVRALQKTTAIGVVFLFLSLFWPVIQSDIIPTLLGIIAKDHPFLAQLIRPVVGVIGLVLGIYNEESRKAAIAADPTDTPQDITLPTINPPSV